MAKGKRLTQEERFLIFELSRNGKSVKQITDHIEREHSTVAKNIMYLLYTYVHISNYFFSFSPKGFCFLDVDILRFFPDLLFFPFLRCSNKRSFKVATLYIA